MERKNKALEIANKFITKSVFYMNDSELKTERENAKINAIKCVDIIVDTLKLIVEKGDIKKHIEYWDDVKSEINALP